ncbi:MAG: non-ribosomal peptide synthetase, partial [Lentisphaerae bacterium]
LGVYLPPREVPSSEIIQACRQKILYPLERLTGIRFRRMAGDIEFAIDLAREAVKKCLARSRFKPEEIDLIISCNISRYDGPNFQFSFEPSTSVRLRRDLGLESALCFDISNACAGMFTGVNIADAFLKAGLVRNVLIVSGEYITHLTRTAQMEIRDERDERIACLTLGDAGAAAILTRSEDDRYGFHDIEMYTLSEYSDCCIARPTDSKAGGAIMLTDSIRIHTVAIRESVKHVIQKLRQMNWSRESLKHFVMHQTARGAISELARQVNEYYRAKMLDHSNMIYNVERRGNTSSTTHFVAIWDNILNNRIQNGDNIVFAVQASGITLGTAPYTFDDLPDRLRAFEANENEKNNVEENPADSGRQAGEKSISVPTIQPSAQSKLKNISEEVPFKITIESIATLSDDEVRQLPHSAIQYAVKVIDKCFNISSLPKEEIDLLIYAGVHRDQFLSEPAIASILAGETKINSDVPPDSPHKTFAYDVLNGSVGFLNACSNAMAMLRSQRMNHVMIVTAEMENNANLRGRPNLGIKETATATILSRTSDGTSPAEGIRAIDFFYAPQYIDAFYSHIGQEAGTSYLDFRRDPNLFDYYHESTCQAVTQFLQTQKLTWDMIDLIAPPQISPDFVQKLGDQLQIPPKKLVNLAEEVDLYTASVPFCLNHLRQQYAHSGKLALILSVGTGVQVGCLLYHFV